MERVLPFCLGALFGETYFLRGIFERLFRRCFVFWEQISFFKVIFRATLNSTVEEKKKTLTFIRLVNVEI